MINAAETTTHRSNWRRSGGPADASSKRCACALALANLKNHRREQHRKLGYQPHRTRKNWPQRLGTTARPAAAVAGRRVVYPV